MIRVPQPDREAFRKDTEIQALQLFCAFLVLRQSKIVPIFCRTGVRIDCLPSAP